MRYIATGNGNDSQLVRRICRGARPAGRDRARQALRYRGQRGSGHVPEAPTYLPIPTADAPVRRPRSCFIDIHGAYDFHLDAQRRVEGESGSDRPPGCADERARARRLQAGAPVLDRRRSTPVGCRSPATTSSRTPTAAIVGGATPTLFPRQRRHATGRAHRRTCQQPELLLPGPRGRRSSGTARGPRTRRRSRPARPRPSRPTLDTAAGDAATSGRITATWSLAVGLQRRWLGAHRVPADRAQPGLRPRPS